MRCPVCESENSDDAAECQRCGKQLQSDAEILEDIEPIAGLEETIQQGGADLPTSTMPDLELTQVTSGEVRIADEFVPGLEQTQVAEDPAAPSRWTGGVELDLGREIDTDARTEAPQDTGLCPWCGAPAEGAVCDSCGRRKFKYSEARAAPARARSDETVLCPACFSRVPVDERCSECGVRLVTGA